MRSVCLSLEFDFEGERVTGWLADEHGNDWAFSCWLDLLTLIERLLAGAHMPAGNGSGATSTTAAQERRAVKGALKS